MTKGLGFLLGAAMLATRRFVWPVLTLVPVSSVVFVTTLFANPESLPKDRESAKFLEVFSKSANVNWLSLARVFLFGARDLWFVMGIPIYFYTVLPYSSAEGNRTARTHPTTC